MPDTLGVKLEDLPTDGTDLMIEDVRRDKYRWTKLDGTTTEHTWPDTLQRVSEGLFSGDEKNQLRCLEFLYSQEFVPAGRILSGAGTSKMVTWTNCFVSPLIQDSMRTEPGLPGLGIMDSLSAVAYSMQMGGGVGQDFTPIRPRNAVVKRVGSWASGPLSFADMWQGMCGTIMSAGCLTWGTKILTEEGPIEIGRLVQEKIQTRVWTRAGWKKITHHFDQGTKYVFELKLETGQTLRATPEHKWVIYNPETGELEKKETMYLQTGDRLFLLRGGRTWGKNPSEGELEEAWLVGLYHADGYAAEREGNQQPVICGAVLGLGKKDELVWERAKELWTRKRPGHLGFYDRKDHCREIKLHSEEIYRDWERRGLLKDGSHKATIPTEFWASSELTKAYLAGFHAGDGKQGKKAGICWQTTSEILAEDVTRALALMGIPSKTYAEDRQDRGWKTLYTISVTSRSWTADLEMELGQYSPYPFYVSGAENGFSFPAKWRNAETFGNLKTGPGKPRLRNFGPRHQNISMSVLERTDDTLLKTLVPVQITEIGATGEDQVYDIEVEDEHTYTAEGFYSSNSRRGAMMLTLRCDHPDVWNPNQFDTDPQTGILLNPSFISAKRQKGRLTYFNMSILITDEFMRAVENDDWWALGHRIPPFNPNHIQETRERNGEPWYVYRTVKARQMWEDIMSSTYKYAEPGIIFIDRINQQNNLWYCEEITCTNPCGEQPLPPHGACCLSALNLPTFVRDPFTDKANVDGERLEEVVDLAIRALDNVIENSPFPLEEQKEEARQKRRVGLGVTGLGTMLMMLQQRYGSDEAIETTEWWMETIRNQAYRTSIQLAKERGPFPLFDKDKYLQGEFVKNLPGDIRDGIYRYGIRNALLLTIAPTGTTTLAQASNYSSGVEPSFAFKGGRRVLQPDGTFKQYDIWDGGFRCWAEQYQDGDLEGAYKLYTSGSLPDYVCTAQDLTPSDHLRQQAACQKYVDASISKTINVPTEYPYEDFKDIYRAAYDLGCKGCTTYRFDPDSGRGAVLTVSKDGDQAQIFEIPPRGKILPGQTYYVKWPGLPYPIFLTINDKEVNDVRRPFELFLNSKSNDNMQWRAAFTRLVSSIFRLTATLGISPAFLVEELNQVVSADPGYFVPVEEEDKRTEYVTSEVAYIGKHIERHLRGLGLLNGTIKVATNSEPGQVTITERPTGSQCPCCEALELIHEEGCGKCNACGYSSCN